MSDDQADRRAVAASVTDLATWVAELSWDTVGSETKDRALLVLFDSLGVMLAGAVTPEVQALAQTRRSESGEAILAGTNISTSIDAACWVNGFALCCLELDEGNKYARGHPGAHVLPALLADPGQASGQDWLTAWLAGYEVAARFGRATQLAPGVHPHGVWGAPGAAAALLKLRGAQPTAIAAAMDAASGLSLAPHFVTSFEGHPVRNLWVGAANAAGVAAARLAESGNNIVTGTAMGSLGTLLGSLDPSKLTSPDTFEIERGYFKRHAACAYTHAPADAILQLRTEYSIEPAEVLSIAVETYNIAASLTSTNWPTRLAAMFSIPYVVSVSLLDGRVGPEASDALHRSDPEVLRLAESTQVTATKFFQDRLPDLRGAKVVIELADGQRVEATQDQPIGDTGAGSFGWDEVRTKLTDLLGTSRTERLESAVRGMETGPAAPTITGVLQCE